MKTKVQIFIKKISEKDLEQYLIVAGCGALLALSTLQALSIKTSVSNMASSTLDTRVEPDSLQEQELYDLFNKAHPEGVEAQEDASFDEAAIEVEGIIYMPPQSMVMLKLKKKNEMILKVGDSVYKSIRVKDIQPSIVILENGKDIREFGLESLAIDLFVGMTYDENNNVFLNGSTSAGDTISAPISQVSISKNASIAKILSEIEKSPTAIFKYMTFKQEFDGDALIGVRVTLRGADSKVFEEAGLMNNDLVSSINGFDASEFSTPKFLNSLKKFDSIEFKIKRDGLDHTINISR